MTNLGIHGIAKVLIYTGVATGKLYFSLADNYGVYNAVDAADLVAYIAKFDFARVSITVDVRA